jgi:hypothetical protein
MTEILSETERNWGQNGGKSNALDKLKEKWPSTFVSRDRIEEFTEGLFKQTSMNTMDARGDGINKRYRIGNRVFYEVDEVIEWLKTKVK